MSSLPKAALAVFASQLAFGAAPPVVCPAGAPIGNIDLRVRNARGGVPLPLKTINRLEEGDAILYRPLVRATETRKGEVAIVLVAAVREPNQDQITVLTPRRAAQPAEWKVPSRSSVAAFVYGPAGLNAAKVKQFLSKDDGLIAQLADYAEKTSQTEALLQALASDTGSGETLNAAFQGFASQYGFSAQLDRTLPPNQQMMLALRSLNPAVAGYDPISPQPSQRIGQTASLATSIAALFFGSPVGLAAGGAAMLLEMRSVVFPNTIFRSSFAQPIPEDGLGLCGHRDAVPPHTKVAYLWATRVPNIGPPHVTFQKALSLPAGMKAPLPVEVPSDIDWKYLDRARKWTLEPIAKSGKSFPVAVHQDADPKALQIDLTKSAVIPGKYRLTANWDWDSFAVSGEVNVAGLGAFEKARLAADSQDHLIAKSGRVVVSMEGADFQFVTKAELIKPGDKFFTPAAVPFAVPQGFREGTQPRMDLQVNTGDLDAGDYRLLLTQADGKTHPVPIALLPPPPRFDNLPLLVNCGVTSREITLKGEHLNLLAALKAPGLGATLGPAKPDGSERQATLQLDPNVTTGKEFDLQAYVENRSTPLMLQRAVRIVGPLPSVTGSKVSMPPGLKISLQPGELPADYVLSALVHVSGFAADTGIALQCRGDNRTGPVLHTGLKGGPLNLEHLGMNQFFLTFADGIFQNNCELLAMPEPAEASGGSVPESQGYWIGRIVHVPKIELLKFNGLQVGPPIATDPVRMTLYGRDLETIERVGWDPDHPNPVVELPSPLPDEGPRQMLPITLPIAPATLPLYVWLRGDTKARATTIYPAQDTE